MCRFIKKTVKKIERKIKRFSIYLKIKKIDKKSFRNKKNFNTFAVR